MTAPDKRTTEGILFTDEYQLTMAQLYFRAGLHEKTAQFDHFFRTYPNYGQHQAGYCISAGLGLMLDWMETARFGEQEIAYLAAQTGRGGHKTFAPDFLDWLRKNGTFDGLTIRAIPEGRVVHPHAPLTVVQGPLAMAQILESALLNQINYQTLIATKAARIRASAQGGAVLEFGLRRAQGTGANAGTRAALIGGADFSSNLGMSEALGFPPKGTHAHSMVQLYMALGEGEIGAFRAYADLYPDDCTLLVDTINVLESGVPNAIRVFEELHAKGHTPVGIRIDSGDLAYLSIQAARMLDQAGFGDTTITLSSDLDELVIWQVQTQIREEAGHYGVDATNLLRRLTYGVGTRLITSEGDPALGGVYKLVAVKQGDNWTPAIKVSDTPEKMINPGHKNVWRIYDKRGRATADLLSRDDEDPAQMPNLTLRHPTDATKFRSPAQADISRIEPLLETVWHDGTRTAPDPTIADMRKRRIADLERLDEGVKRMINPHIYHVSLTEQLWQLKQELIAQARQHGAEPTV